MIKSWFLGFRYSTDQLKENNNSYLMLSFSMGYAICFYVYYLDFG